LIPEGIKLKIQVTLPPLAVKNQKPIKRAPLTTTYLKKFNLTGTVHSGNAAMPWSRLCVASRRYKH